MPIPDFQTIMLPMLKTTSDMKEHNFRNIIDSLAQEFQLSREERREMLPSRTSFLFDNRVGWARLYLVRAGLLVSTRRGFVKITKRGLDALEKNPSRIDNSFLEQYPEFIEFIKPDIPRIIKIRPRATRRGVPTTRPAIMTEETPEETLTHSYEFMKQELAKQLMAQVASMSYAFFEKMVIDLLVAMGYGGSLQDAGKVVGKSGDEGIDGIIKEDRLGLDAIYVQAKKWGNTTIGRPELHKFVGALQGQKADKGIFITTSKFSKDAIDYVSKVGSKIVLIDGERLAELMIDNGIGVSTVINYAVKKLDTDYFAQE
jgi:restriction system protein